VMVCSGRSCDRRGKGHDDSTRQLELSLAEMLPTSHGTKGKSLLLIGWGTDHVQEQLSQILPKSVSLRVHTTAESHEAVQTVQKLTAQGSVVHVNMPEPHMQPLMQPWRAASDESSAHPITVLAMVPVSHLLQKHTWNAMTQQMEQSDGDEISSLHAVLRYLLHFRGHSHKTKKTVMAVSHSEMQSFMHRAREMWKECLEQDPEVAHMHPDLDHMLENLIPKTMGFRHHDQKFGYLEPREVYNVIVDATHASKAAKVIAHVVDLQMQHPKAMRHDTEHFDTGALLSQLHQKIAADGSALQVGTMAQSLNKIKRYAWRSDGEYLAPFARLVDFDPPYAQVPGIVAIRMPLRYANEVEKFEHFKAQGNYFIGVSSYQDFPAMMPNPYEGLDYKTRDIFADPKWYDKIIGWCHMFRKPERHIPSELKTILLPESDFMDPQMYVSRTEKKYDVLYSCQSGPWQEYCRNWPLGSQCVQYMADQGLKICLVGKQGDADAPVHPNITCTPFMANWTEFRENMAASRFVFLPNIHDASPRVATEALLSDVPVMINENILGGWHLINEHSGETFRTFQQFKDKFPAFWENVKSGKFSPRAWWTERHGPDKAGARLAQFVDSLPRQTLMIAKKPSFKYAAPDNEKANNGISYIDDDAVYLNDLVVA